MRQKILDLFNEVNKLEKISAEAARKSYSSANEASGGLVASYSAAGDVEHARNSANLSVQKVKQIKKLMNEIVPSLDNESPLSIEPVCYVSVKFDDGRMSEFYFVKNSIYLPGFSLISPDSLLGKSILDKNVGDKFTYSAGDIKYTGEIIKII
jgi:hypothetical protein